MELASTAAAVAETAEKVYEGTQEIRKVCNATTEVKNVADSEGKDQLDATIGMASSREMSSTTASQPESAGASSDIRSDKSEPGIPDKSMSDSTPLGTASDNPLKGAAVFDEGIPAGAASQNPLKGATVFDEGIPAGATSQNPLKGATVFDEGIPRGSGLANPLKDATVLNADTSLGSNAESALRSTGKSVSETSLETNRIESLGPDNQYISLEKDAQWRNEHSESELDLGKPKSADVLRNNMLTVMGEDGRSIEKSFSRAHHIVGDSDYTDVAKKQLEKYGIDINDPMNGIFLPNDENSPLKGTIHEGRHFKDYCNEVNQRLAGCTSRQDCLEVLDSIKKDLYNGELALYNDHKFNQ